MNLQEYCRLHHIVTYCRIVYGKSKDYTSLCDEVDDILHSNIMYLKVSTGVKISTFMENNKGG